MTCHLAEALLAPVSPGTPGGSDLAMSPDLDEIRGARKGEDGDLSQGDWVRELRTPQWSRVRELCETILRERSKDLQVACWYAEAMTTLEGFGGLAQGLRVVEGILERYWDTCHPALEGGSAEERVGRIEWLDGNLALAVKQIPLTAPAAGGYSWLKWEESLNVDNLGLRNPQAKEDAIGEGKVPGDVFQKSVTASGPHFYDALQGRAREALDAGEALQAALDRRLGNDGPGIEALTGAIRGCLDFVTQTRQRRFPSATPSDVDASAAPSGTSPHPVPPSGPIASRADAILGLRATAAFFRTTEPHSPVAFLVERAAAWAEMPLDAWLGEVIKDAPTLTQLRELLNLKKETKQA